MTTPSLPRHTITLQTGRFTTDGSSSLLDAALASGTPVPFSCQRGACGSCRAEVVDGAYERIAAPTDGSFVPAHNEILMCQCRALGDLTLRFSHWTATPRPQRRQVSVVSRRSLTANVTQLIVQVQGEDALDYLPGQHVQFLLDDGSRRSFSIANAPVAAGPQTLEFHIQRLPGGVFTDGVLPQAMPNDSFEIDGPHGCCVWPPLSPDAVEHLVLLATGTGFAGVYPILMAAMDSDSLKTVTLYWGARELNDCYASILLDAIQRKHKDFQWIPALSGSAPVDSSHLSTDASTYVQNLAAAAAHDWARTMVYACGSNAMVRAAREHLGSAGLPADRFQSEAFLPSSKAAHFQMPATQVHAWERVGQRFTMEGILSARQRSMEALREIAALMRPGMSTREAITMADGHLHAMGALHNWHPTYVRFGPDTQSPAVQPTDFHRCLGEDDIFVIDIGPVWNGYEGDYGDTFVMGNNADRLRCARAAHDVFLRTRVAWLQGVTGSALYDLAEDFAREHGCALLREIPGHRVSDFPHALYGKHQLAQADFIPSDGIWVLEIQVRDLGSPIGAFYEDVLLR